MDCKCKRCELKEDSAAEKIMDDSYSMPVLVKENVDHPSHYRGNELEVISVIEDFNLNFCMGNAIKYILRAGKKGNKVEDLSKAIWYLEEECRKVERETS